MSSLNRRQQRLRDFDSLNVTHETLRVREALSLRRENRQSYGASPTAFPGDQSTSLLNLLDDSEDELSYHNLQHNSAQQHQSEPTVFPNQYSLTRDYIAASLMPSMYHFSDFISPPAITTDSATGFDISIPTYPGWDLGQPQDNLREDSLYDPGSHSDQASDNEQPSEHEEIDSQPDSDAEPFSNDQYREALYPLLLSPGHSHVSSSTNPLNMLSDDARKTRRLRPDTNVQPSPYYGRYGQVESGPLQMEIVQENGPIFMTCAEINNTMLPDVRSYDFDVASCNIVLQHQNATPFSLQKIVIRAPKSRFMDISPAGMVFLAMEKDDVFRRTACYQMPTGNRTQHRRLEQAILTGSNLESDGNEGQRDSTDVHGLPREFRADPSQHVNVLVSGGNEESDNESIASDEYHVHYPEFGFDLGLDVEETFGIFPGTSFRMNRRRRQPPRSPPNRIGTLPFENDERPIRVPPLIRHHSPSTPTSNRHVHRAPNTNGTDFLNRLIERYSALESHRHDRGSSNTSLDVARQASQAATQDAVRAVGGSLLIPQARFVMENSKCTIEFESPLTTRNILLKMWCPAYKSGHTFLQSIEVIGFAGPQFSPAIQLR
ncbi:uncharacterized protein BROUX77_002052 [Berkeleyomyces rouxiae]|uniref:uncharacterized protein n=1 Tax=Berkeleyomyces rouxiae TaxID=2035830 RepID=UPI003B8163D6